MDEAIDESKFSLRLFDSSHLRLDIYMPILVSFRLVKQIWIVEEIVLLNFYTLGLNYSLLALSRSCLDKVWRYGEFSISFEIKT